VISGPSGVGKGTVVRLLLERRPDLSLSVSATTRDPRPDEVDGRDYRFVTRRQFDHLIEDGAFLEWADIYGDHQSGTLLAPVADDLESGRDVVLEVDVQGAASIKEKMPGAVLIFLAPPSREELARRLRERRTESESQLERRLAAADEEMRQASWFHHQVVNEDAEEAAEQVAAIIDANRAGT